MKAWLFVGLTALLAATAAAPVPAVQDAADAPLRVTSAIYGSAAGSVDVTPIVRLLARPDLDEFYVAPQWLQVDPSVGQTKQLVVFYEYRGAPHVISTVEPGALSYRILLEEADSSLRTAATASRDETASIVTAYYGIGASFSLVTARARELIRPESEPLVVDGPILGVRPGATNGVLILTYLYRGGRHTLVVWRGGRVNYSGLTTYAAAGIASDRSNVAPAWIASAKPDPPRAPGTTGPGVGRAPRRELGISELLKASTELQAITPADRSPAVGRALTSIGIALESAQRDMGYPYPPPGSPRPQADTAGPAAHIALAIHSLTIALDQFGAATPGRRGGRGDLPATLSRIKEALGLLDGTSGTGDARPN